MKKTIPGTRNPTALLRIQNLKKSFQMGTVTTDVLRGVDLEIFEGDFLAIVGASGSGKSTLLNMIGLLDLQTSGKIFLKGHDVAHMSDDQRADLRSKVFGFVFQQYNLIPWLSAFENVTLPLIFARKKIDEAQISEQSKSIGLGERMHHRPFELSGGEQQRVALMRALSNDPDIIIGDEPTGNLDSETGHRILDMLIDLNKMKKKTLIIVTHDASIAKRADKVIILKDGLIIKHQLKNGRVYIA